MDTTKLKEFLESWMKTSYKYKHLAFRRVYREFLKLGIEAFSQPPEKGLYNSFGICYFTRQIYDMALDVPMEQYIDIYTQTMGKLFLDENIDLYVFCDENSQEMIYDLKYNDCYFERANFLKKKLAELEKA
jgi:hypothetical protein